MARLAPLTLCAVALAWTAASPARADAHAQHRHRRAKAEDAAARAPRGGKHRVPLPKPESIGSPNDGKLSGGAHLDLTRPYFRVVTAYESGDARWGMPSLIHMIDRAAHRVAQRFPGSALDVGDISQRTGGDLRRHHSHESGRDADLGFYVVDAKGKQIHAHTFIKFDTSMASPTVPGARYDLARNWTLVQELLTDPVAHVSHVFVAEWVRHELLNYARPRVSHALWERAAVTLMQPHNALPHDDHFHVRISCPREARAGCVEIARVAHHPKSRVARKSAASGHVLRTPIPAGAVHVARPPAASAPAPLEPAVPVLPVEPRRGGDVDDHDGFDD